MTEPDRPDPRAATGDPNDGRPVGNAALFFGLLGGAIAWSLHLLASYPLVGVACHFAGDIILNAVTLATATLALAATVVAWRSWRLIRHAEPRPEIENRLRRARFMALSGMILSGFFLFVTVVEGMPVWLQGACGG